MSKEKEIIDLENEKLSPDRVMEEDDFLNPSDLVARMGGSYASMLGLDLKGLDSDEIYKWFIAAVFYGAPIPGIIATRTWHIFVATDMLKPQKMIDCGWNKLVDLLDQGGYVRYDYKTATKLLEVNQALLENYHGDFNVLHAVAINCRDLEKRIMDLGKGIGRVTTYIFLRELRGKWPKADPPLSPLALTAARMLGYLPDNSDMDASKMITALQNLWKKYGMTAESFCDFEAALTRQGLDLRHHATRAQTIKRRNQRL